MKALLIGMLFWSTSTFAGQTKLDLMSTCKTKDGQQVLSLYRDMSNHHLGILHNYNQDLFEAYMVNIQYTNAGARAIVVSEELPMLILFGTSSRDIDWNGSTWNCQSHF